MADNKGREVQLSKAGSSDNLPADKKIYLTDTDIVDLSGLSDRQVEELKSQYAKGMIDIHKKAAEMKVDVAALGATLESLVGQTDKATRAGAHVTMTHTQKTSIGTTEVMMGNTERAAAGKISRFAAGEQDRTLIIVGIIAAAAVIAALLLAR